MHMLYSTFIVFHVQCHVCVMVVIDVLAMHHHVFKLFDLLCHRHRTEYGHRLPQEDRQKDKGAKAA